MTNQETDERLLEEAAQGKTAAFQILYERYRDPIFRFAYRMLGSVEAAEDVAHDCFLGLIKEPGRFDSTKASLRTYLYAAARNQAAKRYLNSNRESGIDELVNEPRVAAHLEPIRQVLDNELAGEVQRAIESLPPLQREALVLFEYEGLALNEIAEVVGTDVGAVKSRLHRARGRLRNSLAPYLNTNPEIVTLEQA